jgi:hypothetical protein
VDYLFVALSLATHSVLVPACSQKDEPLTLPRGAACQVKRLWIAGAAKNAALRAALPAVSNARSLASSARTRVVKMLLDVGTVLDPDRYPPTARSLSS